MDTVEAELDSYRSTGWVSILVQVSETSRTIRLTVISGISAQERIIGASGLPNASNFTTKRRGPF
jgi:hypothetical protein